MLLDNVLTLLSVSAPLALMISLWVIAQISRRFGEVTHRPPIYRMFYIAMALLILPVGMRLLGISLTEQEQQDAGGNSIEALLHDLPIALSLVLALVIAWRYWGWLVYAREGESPVASRPSK